MSSTKSSFATLNRWFSKKNKDKNGLSNGKLSKSSTSLSVGLSPTVDINETSQLEYNRITPTPTVTSNAPFEQNFRLTVLLPKDQLYVARLGARVPLSKLLNLVCENKLLDADKYEFRNPVDPSQVYNCELTIGAVGLSEIRLCHKTDPYDNFNNDDVYLKQIHRTSAIRDSLSSSEFSSRNSKHTTKTTSPYSSSNSLNSMDSSSAGHHQRSSMIAPSSMPKVTAPPRKKRTAPRPPSQFVQIPEKDVFVIPNGETTKAFVQHQQQQQRSSVQQSTERQLLPRKDYYVSTPNLNGVDLNGNDQLDDSEIINTNNNKNNNNGNSNNNNNNNNNNDNNNKELPMSNDSEFDDPTVVNNLRNRCGGSVQHLWSNGTSFQKLPEPSPRKRLVQIKKKPCAPIPPLRDSSTLNGDDTLSITSASLSVVSTPDAPMTPMTPLTPELQRAGLQLSEHSSTASTMTLESRGTREVVAELVEEEKEPSIAVVPKPLARTVAATTPSVIPATGPAKIQLESDTMSMVMPKPVPRLTTNTSSTNITTSTTLLNSSHSSFMETTSSAPQASNTNNANVSKVMLNCSPTPMTEVEDQSDGEEPPPLPTSLPDPMPEPTSLEQINSLEVEILDLGSAMANIPCTDDDDNVSKQADSGIGEPVPSPIPDSLPSEGSPHECKSSSTFESSSDDDDMIKVYNFKLGKTVVQPLSVALGQPTQQATDRDSDDHGVGNGSRNGTASTPTSSITLTSGGQAETTTSSWNFSIPISPPPNFADDRASMTHNHEDELEQQQQLYLTGPTDTPIKPKIKQRPLLNFDTFTADKTEENFPEIEPAAMSRQSRRQQSMLEAQDTAARSLPSPTAQLNEIVDELNEIINGNRMDKLIRKSGVDQHTADIEAAKPNPLTNFSITTISNKTPAQPLTPVQDQEQEQVTINSTTTITPNNTPTTTPTTITPPPIVDDDKLYRKRGSITNGLTKQQRKSITRADSFHSTVQQKLESKNGQNGLSSGQGLNSRSSSYLSLTKMVDQNGLKRRSSSELSIGESPSLQSLEVIKNILSNSRKNSLANSSNSDSGDNEEVTTSALTTTETSHVLLDVKPKSDPIIINNNNSSSDSATSRRMENQSAEVDVEQPTMAKPLPKVYRYSGPPSINFASWSERPKSQAVAIKNEGDYIFGGNTVSVNKPQPVGSAIGSASATVTATNMQASSATWRASTPAPSYGAKMSTKSAAIPPPVAAKPDSIILRMGIPDKKAIGTTTFSSVPVTVKPLKDVVVESAEPTAVTMRNVGRSGFTTLPERQTKSVIGHMATLPRYNNTNINGSSSSSSSNQQQVNRVSSASVNISVGPTLLRSRSITKLDTNKPVTAGGSEPASVAAPFGQNTLRKTGLKDKMLAKETPSDTTDTAETKVKANIAPRTEPIVQKHTSVVSINAAQPTNGHNNVVPTPSTISSATTTSSTTITQTTKTSVKLELKLPLGPNTWSNQKRLLTQKSVPIIGNSHFSTIKSSAASPKTATTPPPPPPPPIAALVKLKPISKSQPNSTATTPTTANGVAVDPRSQLLDAIRNFKRDELNRT